MTGVEVVIGNCLPEVHKILLDFRNKEKNFQLWSMTLAAICLVILQRMRLSSTVTEIYCLINNGVTTLTFWGHVTSSVT